MVITESITETSFTTMAKDTRVTFDSSQDAPPSKHKVHCTRPADRQISYEDAENCVNEMSESFPALTTRAHKFMRQVSGSFNSRTIKIALILSVILNLLLAIPFGIFFGIWMSQKNDVTSPALSPSPSFSLDSNGRPFVKLCVPCGKFNFELSHKVKVRSNNDICCADDLSSAEYDILAPTSPGPGPNVYPQVLPCQLSGNVDAKAHLVLDVMTTKANVKNRPFPQNLFSWVSDHKDKNSYVGSGVKYSNGHFVIQKRGTYFIYNHLTLSTIENTLDINKTDLIIQHSIQKMEPGDHGKAVSLASNSLTLKRSEVRDSNVQGLFDLNEGDIVYVYLSYPSVLKGKSGDMTTLQVFGLFLVK
ncbi:uncharacterized protein LOC131952174 isoform X2 [Physella acuta]|uniref:uncharacterized protein LOC131952174 isoform X2 n=1 Tax=Physella acuta TaxID=109671 RepID=UPI0027DC59B5|nr:uncharacterized protein LOC131952174 isoform X2 [Physella acuta]